MSTKKDTPAFPAMGNTTYPGMTLRDWFAGQMLVGMKLSDVRGREEWFAQTAYSMADAMLAARERADEP